MGKTTKKIGLAPGALVYVGQKRDDPVTMHVVDFVGDRHTEKPLETPADAEPLINPASTTWISIDGVHDASVIARFGELLKLHPLVLEDLMNTAQRPKLEVHEGYIFCVLKIITGTEKMRFDHVGLILREGVVATFQSKGSGPVFEPVRTRARDERARLRSRGADYLLYALIDALVDHYFPVLEASGERIARLETEVIERPSPTTLQTILRLKRAILQLRRSVWPLREVVHGLQRTESELITPETQTFLRDLYDHAVQIIDTIEGQREMLSEMVNLYLSSVSNQMNGGMRVLAVVATIFMPLTLIAGIYGMNFEHMPELHWPWAYPTIWVVLVGTATSLIGYFRHKGWI